VLPPWGAAAAPDWRIKMIQTQAESLHVKDSNHNNNTHALKEVRYAKRPSVHMWDLGVS
jgi:hypothetical protein